MKKSLYTIIIVIIMLAGISYNFIFSNKTGFWIIGINASYVCTILYAIINYTKKDKTTLTKSAKNILYCVVLIAIACYAIIDVLHIQTTYNYALWPNILILLGYIGYAIKGILMNIQK